MTKKTNPWDEIVGQEKAKSRVDFHIQAYSAGEALPSMFFVAPRGYGKTSIAQAAGARLKEMSNGAKRCFTVNCASIKNLKQFWGSIVMPIVNDRDMTLLLDEASELPMDVTMALLTMINPNKSNRNSYTYDDYTVDIDLKRQTFLLATTEVHKIFPALLNRTRRIDLDTYSLAHLGEILQRNAPDVKFEENILNDITPVLRGTPRQAVMMASDIKTYLATLKRQNFNRQDWTALSNKLDILPLGLSRLELKVLHILAKDKDVSLTRIAAMMGMTTQSVRQDLELNLQSFGLMDISTAGRNITQRGQSYLKQVAPRL